MALWRLQYEMVAQKIARNENNWPSFFCANSQKSEVPIPNNRLFSRIFPLCMAHPIKRHLRRRAHLLRCMKKSLKSFYPAGSTKTKGVTEQCTYFLFTVYSTVKMNFQKNPTLKVTIRKISNRAAVHLGGIRHPPRMVILHTYFVRLFKYTARNLSKLVHINNCSHFLKQSKFLHSNVLVFILTFLVNPPTSSPTPL
jgi:hypothetical protein